jgi:hypothetical protein
MLALVGFVAFVIVFSVAGAAWRTRPQLANPRTEARFAFFVLVLAVAGVMSSGPNLGRYVVAAAPVALVAGWRLGRALRGTLSFWTDTATGRLKFRGGSIFFVVLAVSALSRVCLRYLLTGSIAGHSDPVGMVPQALMVLAGTLLFMDAGLYFARAQAIAAAAGERVSWRWFSAAAGRA